MVIFVFFSYEVIFFVIWLIFFADYFVVLYYCVGCISVRDFVIKESVLWMRFVNSFVVFLELIVVIFVWRFVILVYFVS